MKKILFLAPLLLTLIVLSACQIPFFDTDNKNEDNGDSNLPSTYTVSFAQTGIPIDSQEIVPGGLCKKPSSPVRTGYTFAGWYLGDTEWDFNTNTVNDNIELCAMWKPINYRITYILNGGSFDSEIPESFTVESKTIYLPEPYKENYDFAGWYNNGHLVTKIQKGTIGSVRLEAVFNPSATVVGSNTATAKATDNIHNITVKLTDSTSSDLTVKVFCPRPWETVKVTIGNKHEYVKTYTENDSLMLDLHMTSNGDDAVITPIILKGENILETNYGIILSNGTKIDTNYYPGFVRKAVTFTIDDGNLALDEKFISIVKPAGILGTFNLCRTTAGSAQKYLSLYSGYEVANHHTLHCLPWRENFDFSKIIIKNEIFNSSTADVKYMYITSTPGLYYIDYKYFSSSSKSPYWHPIATNETYTQYVDITKNDIEQVFGEGSVVGFAYPHGTLNSTVKQYLIDAGYLYARKTGVLDDKTAFSLPEDRFEWTYNANVTNLNECMEKFDNLSDTGELKFFSFGVHSKDFEGQWEVLEKFARKYGNRPEDFYYASNRDIFEYQDALEALEIYDDKIVNPTGIDIFVTINNVKTIILANSTYTL